MEDWFSLLTCSFSRGHVSRESHFSEDTTRTLIASRARGVGAVGFQGTEYRDLQLRLCACRLRQIENLQSQSFGRK